MYTSLILLLLLNFAKPECTCFNTLSVKEEIKETDVVFVGTVVKQGIVKEPYFIYEVGDSAVYDTIYRRSVIISIDKYYNGKSSYKAQEKEVKIITGIGNGDCGFNFQMNKKYIVYAHLSKSKESYSTNICTKTSDYTYLKAKEIELYVKPKYIE